MGKNKFRIGFNIFLLPFTSYLVVRLINSEPVRSSGL